MTTYKELIAQAEALMAQAEQARKAELSGVIADIKAKIKEYSLSATDLGFGAASGRKVRAPKAPVVVKYRGPNGETWAGGLGRKPEWVRALLAENKDIENYRV
jgi:DNA-binding protein H-NS